MRDGLSDEPQLPFFIRIVLIDKGPYRYAVDQDWRQTGQGTYLAGRRMRFTRWFPYRIGWDHDHCDFCWAKISDGIIGHADYNEAWVTSDDSYTWVCPKCFDDFRGRFNWVVVGD